MKHAFIYIITIGSLLLAVWWWLRPSQASSLISHQTETSRRPPAQASRIADPTVDNEENTRKQSMSEIAHDEHAIAEILQQSLRVMRQGKQDDIDSQRALLDKIFTGGKGNTNLQIAAILIFLRTGENAPTGKGFVVGEMGALTQATTLRVYLMNKLGILSRETGGEAALEIAHDVLVDFGSADEWAVSMRNVAWFDPSSREFLQNRVSAMLGHMPWRDSPSAGMLEAFDVIVHTGAVAMVPELSRLSAAVDSPLARASNVALDRLASRDAYELTTFLNQQPELLTTAPLHRAGLFAHANLKDPGQRKQVELYLLRGDVSTQERQKFLASLIQSGQFVSYNLITPLVPPELPELARQRLQILTQVVSEWQVDNRFGDFTSEFQTMSQKLDRIRSEIATEDDR
jgi:hypothetical protein